jgi:biotin transport system substrate-specific component
LERGAVTMSATSNTFELIKSGFTGFMDWRRERSLVQKIALSLAMAALTGLMAQVRFPLPWTPVPLTGQTFAVLLSGVLLGQWWGGASMALYVGLGALGLPWFTGWSGGLSHLAGPTGGYAIGFILAALFLGYTTDRSTRARTLPGLLALMLFANFALIYLPGVLQFTLWANLVQGKTTGLLTALNLSVLPFIAGDVIKVILAALAARGVAPRADERPTAGRGSGC